MKSFHWDDNFETGLADVDGQHLYLVELINRFGERLVENQIASEDIEVLFAELSAYARYHFEDEEALMAEVGIDRRHLDHHKQIHRNFLDEIRALHAGAPAENPDSPRFLLDFLTHWLAYHILGDDQNMARQIGAIRAGASPGDAYEGEERKRDKATEPLLVALNGLFRQVSARNRELIQLNLSLEEKVAQRTRELFEANRHLEELSLTDALTGLPNRRHAMRRLAALWEESVDTRAPLACLMVDADHFKKVNDTCGHDAGDLVLVELATTLQHCLRSDDIVCRLGGDEFFIICPKTDVEGGMHIAELTRKTVSELRVATGGEPWPGSISVGVAVRSEEMRGYEALIKKADEGVYAAKQAGKNCVRAA